MADNRETWLTSTTEQSSNMNTQKTGRVASKDVWLETDEMCSQMWKTQIIGREINKRRRKGTQRERKKTKEKVTER